jgi:two-component system NtrC family sensor kinase
VAETDERLAVPLAAHEQALEGQRAAFEIELAGRVFQGAVEPIYDEEGRIAGCVGVGLDVTERRQAEAALIASEKLALTGRMATSLAHEINNPLQAVIGLLSLAEEDLRAGVDALRYIQTALQELERAAGLVARMRNLNRPPDVSGREAADVNDLVERVLVLTRKRCQERGVTVAWAPAADLPWPALLADQVQQVFMNLVLNAVEAMPDGGQLQVCTERTGDPPGVRVHFSDNGIGIPAGELPHLFEPFYTTKELGLGLGLPVSRAIVEGHGGRIEVESVAGEGTAFAVWLPA